MKTENIEDFYRALLLVSQIDEEFIELGSLLHKLQETAPEDFQALLSLPQLGKRKGYYLVEIDRAFANSGVPAKRLKKIGWTKLQIIARHVTPENCEQLLELAETHIAKNLEKIMRGEEPIIGGQVSAAAVHERGVRSLSSRRSSRTGRSPTTTASSARKRRLPRL